MRCSTRALVSSVLALLAGSAAAWAGSPVRARETHFLPAALLAAREFGNDAPWYRRNVPFFRCSDPLIEQTYYYRWKLYKAHLKDLGERGYLVTEFLDNVGWSLKPYESLNDATAFHIREGRWLRDRRYVDQYLDFMYHGGNDRHFSEAIAAAAYDRYLVHGDRAEALKNLPAMKQVYRQWDDHFDRAKGLYFIEPLLDATEYSIASIDASGGRDGFFGGHAFRPTINSFMYANALAISRLSGMDGDARSAAEFSARAARLRERVQRDLWSEELEQFIDRYQVNNRFVHYWDPIRGRELAGYTPWYFDLPDRSTPYAESWRHLLAPDRLGGRFGLRTVEPSYANYMRQYRYVMEAGARKPECQWNGPSWPFQTTLALGGLANLLNDYPPQGVAGTGDYLRLLRQYARQHYPSGRPDLQPDLQEDYDADTGRVIVGLQRSHHYNHSGFEDLVITGLVGLRPRADEVLEVNPLLPTDPREVDPITDFCLENVPYHGRLVTILYDRDGRKYERGAGLSVYVNGRRVVNATPLGRVTVPLPPAMPPAPPQPEPADLAVNLSGKGFPVPSSSAPANPEGLQAAIDGRVWYFPEVANFWTNRGSRSETDWYGVDFGRPEKVRSVRLYFYADGHAFQPPSGARIEYWTGTEWRPVGRVRVSPARPVGNGETVVTFAPVETARLRAVFRNPRDAAIALVELKAYGDRVVRPEPLAALARPAGLPPKLPGLQGENSRTGEFHGARWRDAANGGYFTFDLPVDPSGESALAVTYWGGDAGNCRFEVRVEGVRIAEQTLENNRPGEFFEVRYPIPPALTRGKSRVTVRFQALPGAVAGGVFGARIVRR